MSAGVHHTFGMKGNGHHRRSFVNDRRRQAPAQSMSEQWRATLTDEGLELLEELIAKRACEEQSG